MRTSVESLTKRHQNISIFRTLPCTHLEILSEHPVTIIAAIDNLLASNSLER